MLRAGLRAGLGAGSVALAAAMSLSMVSPQVADAQPLRFDVNSGGGASPTQADWTAVGLGNINNVTFTGVGGILLNERDRLAGFNTAPASSFDDMWRDFVFADERNVQVGNPAGLDITIANLLPFSTYSVSLWAFDYISVPTRSMTWNGAAYTFDGNDPKPFGLTEYRVDFTTTTNGAGVATLNGRIGDSPNLTCCNVFVNGFTLQVVPEPSSVLLLLSGLVVLVGFNYRRRLTE